MKGKKIMGRHRNFVYHHLIWLLLILPLCLVQSCASPEENYDQTSGTTNAHVKEIYDYTVNLPEGDGLSLVEQNCVTCHSLRIIEIQPVLPEKIWKNTVRKMIKNFGAPIHDSLVEAQIVHYLASMKQLQ